jgi:hypothetical protein
MSAVSSSVSRRVVGWLVAAAVLVVVMIDGGSVVLTKLSVPGDAEDAGHAAAGAVAGMMTSQQEAVTAYDAAAQTATPAGLRVNRHDFRVYPDGRVTLTVTRTASTLLFKHLPILRDLAVVSNTQTVSALPFT